jgi:hypothetical protein
MSEGEEKIEAAVTGDSARFLIILLAVILAGVGVFYYLVSSQKPVNQEQASAIILDLLVRQAPPTIRFEAGSLMPSPDVKPHDPHYTLLEKAGYVKLAKLKGDGVRVTVTAQGSDTFAKLPEFKQIKNADGTQDYVVPLANRRLVSVDQITMTSPNVAKVQYTWKWVPTRVGDDFDASGNLVQSFNNWDRAKLIEKYGVDFYRGDPQKATLTLARADKGWKIATQ